MTSKECLKDIQMFINEAYSDNEPLQENQIKSKRVFNDYCNIIKQDLDRLQELEKEYQDLKEWCLILNRHLYIAPEMCELRMATPKDADFLIKNCNNWTKYYNGIDVHEVDYKKFVDLYYSKIKEVLENDR